MPADANVAELFGFDVPVEEAVGMLGWCEPPFAPPIASKVIETGEDYEIVRDKAGRTVRCFKGRRHGFMPTYLKHAVADERDWDQDIEPLLSPLAPQRWEDFEQTVARLKTADAQGKLVVLDSVGGYMYLRALVGPEEICLMLMDNPALVHKMMQTWLELADEVARRVQEHVEIDMLFLAEDICYNHGLLISPDMIREFLLPYYEQLLDGIRRRQKHKRLIFQIDTDGNCEQALDLYASIGVDAMLPFEVAAGNDVVEIGRKYPSLVILGGIDKRVLAAGPEAIDEHLDRIMPVMTRRGGYVPTCDHGVPDDVAYQNYLHYRKRIMEMDH